MAVPTPRFTGIFIPVEILEIEELNPLEQILISWIDALYCKEKGGCFASNQYLAKRLKVKENTIAKSITKLRKIGLLEDVSFDGRTRVIRATISKYIERCQSKSALDLNPNQDWKKIQPYIGKKSNQREKKEIKDKKKEIYKESEGASPPVTPPTNTSNKRKKIKEEKIEVAPRVWLTPSQISSLLEKAKGDELLLKAWYEKLSCWKVGKGIDGGSRDYSAITSWVVDSVETSPQEQMIKTNKRVATEIRAALGPRASDFWMSSSQVGSRSLKDAVPLSMNPEEFERILMKWFNMNKK